MASRWVLASCLMKTALTRAAGPTRTKFTSAGAFPCPAPPRGRGPSPHTAVRGGRRAGNGPGAGRYRHLRAGAAEGSPRCPVRAPAQPSNKLRGKGNLPPPRPLPLTGRDRGVRKRRRLRYTPPPPRRPKALQLCPVPSSPSPPPRRGRASRLSSLHRAMASRPGPRPLTPGAKRREKEEEMGARSEKEPAVAAGLPRHLGKGRRAARCGVMVVGRGGKEDEERGTALPAARLCRRSAGERPPAGGGAAASPPSFPSFPSRPFPPPRQGPAGPAASAGRKGKAERPPRRPLAGGSGAGASPPAPASRRAPQPAAAGRSAGPRPSRGQPELPQPCSWFWTK